MLVDALEYMAQMAFRLDVSKRHSKAVWCSID